MIDLPRSVIEHYIDEWIIGKHAQRDRSILKRRLLDGICYENLACEFDMSVRQIKNIVYKQEKRLFQKIEEGEYRL